MKVLTLRTLALGVAVAAAGLAATAVAAREADPAEPAMAASEKTQAVGETRTQRAGRFSYVTTTFSVPPGAGARGDAFCPKRGQLTGALGSAVASSASDSVTLPAVVVRADGKDRGNVADNGARAFIDNTTGMEAEGRVEVICERGKKRKR